MIPELPSEPTDCEVIEAEVIHSEPPDPGVTASESPNSDEIDFEVIDFEVTHPVLTDADGIHGEVLTPDLAHSELIDSERADFAGIDADTPAPLPDRRSPLGAETVPYPQPPQRSPQPLRPQKPPQLKVQTLNLLKGSIRLLEWTVAQLEAEPVQATNRRSPVIPPKISTLGHQPPSPWQRVQSGWGRVILPAVRSRLPTSLKRTLSNPALTGAIAGVLILLLCTTSALFTSPPSRPIATVPPANPVLPVPEASPSPAPSVPPTLSIDQPTPDQPTVDQTAEAPAVSPIPTVSPSPAPSPALPPLKLTPEQTLIARIQDEVAEVSDQSANGLIRSVQANFRRSLLTVNVSDGWYELAPAQQDKLANDILQRAQQLNFSKLELTDVNTLLARSPVVGAEMVILRRLSRELIPAPMPDQDIPLNVQPS